MVRGDPEGKAHRQVQHHHPVVPTISVSDSALKFTHVLYNLSPAGNTLLLFLLYSIRIGLSCSQPYALNNMSKVETLMLSGSSRRALDNKNNGHLIEHILWLQPLVYAYVSIRLNNS